MRSTLLKGDVGLVYVGENSKGSGSGISGGSSGGSSFGVNDGTLSSSVGQILGGLELVIVYKQKGTGFPSLSVNSPPCL